MALIQQVKDGKFIDETTGKAVHQQIVRER